mmetsp:Transcript_144926/g.403664  ORF Transcript_144926/g.403664 Transcript_144926/m.403664 type:complete len:217 (+) Transcript_144926:55-705(+)
MGAVESHLERSSLHCVACKGELPCRGDGIPEFIEDDSAAMDGDVKNSQAMTNHKLLKAARDGDVEGIQRMLKKGAYIETRRPFVMTPESVATADAALQTRGTGLTPLMYAAQGGYERACEVLIAAGACVNAEDEDGMRPLHFAASSGSQETCKVVLCGGAEPEARDDEGHTALEHVPASDTSTLAEERRWTDLLQGHVEVAIHSIGDRRHGDTDRS